jgi:hypothetical protein
VNDVTLISNYVTVNEIIGLNFALLKFISNLK